VHRSRLALPAAVLLALALALVVSACRHGTVDGRAAVTETAGRMPEIRSGQLDLSLQARTEAEGDAGVDLRGPFSLEEGAPLPRLRMELSGPSIGGAITIISDGQEGWAEAFGQRVPLNEDQQAQLQRTVGALTQEGRLRRLALEEWVRDPRLTDGGEVGGAQTDRIEGDLDVAATVNDLLDFLSVFGRELEPIEGEEADRLRLAVRSSRFELYTGRDDRLLRRLMLEAELAEDLGEADEQLSEFAGAALTFRFGIGRPNEPVEIDTGQPPSS
jgi:hypothetical protein